MNFSKIISGAAATLLGGACFYLLFNFGFLLKDLPLITIVLCLLVVFGLVVSGLKIISDEIMKIFFKRF